MRRENLFLLYSYLQKVNDSSQLYEALSKIFGKQEAKGNRETYTANDSDNFRGETTEDYYRILGLKYGSSEKDIKDAFRELIKKYHPDKFSTLSQEFQDLANRKAQQINKAYEQLMKQFSKS